MSRALVWVFLLADVVGILWCLRVLMREATRLLARWRLRGQGQARVLLELPESFVVVPARPIPRPRPALLQARPAGEGPALRRVG